MAEMDIGFPETDETVQTLDDPPEEKGPSRAEKRRTKRYGDKIEPGPLMAKYDTREAEKALAELHMRYWTLQDEILERPRAQWGVNAYRRAGISNAKLRFNTVDEHWTAWAPKHASPDTTPDVNKAATLCRRLTAQMFIDPFTSEVVVPHGDDEAAAKAEMSDRVLQDLQGEHKLNSNAKGRRALDRTHTYGSGYEWFFVDERGGGQRAVKLMARSDAIHADLALIDPLTGQEGPEMRQEQDPATGMPVQKPVPPQERLVDEEGNFVDDPDQAAQEWLPALDSEVLDSRYVRLIPHTAANIWEATGVLIAAMPTWGEVKRIWPDIETKLDEEDIKHILGFRPAFVDDIMPTDEDEDTVPMKVKGSGGDIWNDERRAFVLCSYHIRGGDYPDGAHLITCGGRFVGHQSGWLDVDDETGEKRALDLPLTQYCGWEEGRDGYWKVGTMELIGGGNEQRYAMVASELDYLERFGRQHIFLPTNSIINEQDFNRPRGSVIRMNPGGKPETLNQPPYPKEAFNRYEASGLNMDDAVGLQTQPGPQTQSGRQEFAVISRQHAGLAEMIESVMNGWTRGSRIVLQLARAFMTEEQEARWGGVGRNYRVSAWKGADLIDSPDVRIKPGSGTMLAPAAKAQLAERFAGMGIMDPIELKQTITTGVGGMLGLTDDPHRVRILNQLQDFMEGPPEGWQPPPVPVIMDPANPTAPPKIADPVLAKMLEPIPPDTLPEIAALRLKEIADRMASPKYLQFPPEWRAGLEIEFQRMGGAMMQAATTGAIAPEGDPGASGSAPAGAKVPGLDQGKQANDLSEDALQEGAPPGMVT